MVEVAVAAEDIGIVLVEEDISSGAPGAAAAKDVVALETVAITFS